MTARAVIVAVLVATATIRSQVRHPVALPDPAHDLVRVELRISTDARFASVRVGGGLFAAGDGRRLAGPDNLRTAVLENLLAFSSNVEGSTGAGAFRFTLAQLTPDTSVRWLLNVQPGHRATFEVYNLNDEANPRLVDRFEGVAGETFSTPASQLRVGGPLAGPRAPSERLVLAFYFPWYERATWIDSQLLDQPLRSYSTEDAADVLRVLQDVTRAGIDGVIVSFQGREVGDGWNHRRMLAVLQAAQQAGVRVTVQIETVAAHPLHQPGPPHPDTIAAWLSDVADLYGSHPAYLRVDGRPVVFLYAWPVAAEEVWREAIARVRASGRQLYLLADTSDLSVLRLVDGIYTFAGSLFATDVGAYSRQQSLASRTYHLLGADRGAQRLGIVTTTPGFDDTRLRERTEHLVVSRQDGSFYQAQWTAALESGADWALVMTWNEWWENTQIEPSQRYGETYLWHTRLWATAFRDLPRATDGTDAQGRR
jgi:hypothetical protein